MLGDLNDTICLPMKLDAFVFNGPVCSGGAEKDEARAKIAPITQPNYTMLRIYDALIQVRQDPKAILSSHSLHMLSPVSESRWQ